MLPPKFIRENLDLVEANLQKRNSPLDLKEFKNLEQKRLDVLNSFVFNVDTPAQLVGVYANYHMRREPLDW